MKKLLMSLVFFAFAFIAQEFSSTAVDVCSRYTLKGKHGHQPHETCTTTCNDQNMDFSGQWTCEGQGHCAKGCVCGCTPRVQPTPPEQHTAPLKEITLPPQKNCQQGAPCTNNADKCCKAYCIMENLNDINTAQRDCNQRCGSAGGGDLSQALKCDYDGKPGMACICKTPIN